MPARQANRDGDADDRSATIDAAVGPPTRKPRLGLLAVDRALELRLVHRRAALDAEVLRLFVQLVARAALGPVGARPLAAAARGRHVLRRGPRPCTRLVAPGALLVDRPRRDLLGARFGGALVLGAVLDVLVLTGALGALLHSARRHRYSLQSVLGIGLPPEPRTATSASRAASSAPITRPG